MINEHYDQLSSNYLFAKVREKTKAWESAHPSQNIVTLGIGDVSLPLPPAVLQAMHTAVDEMGHEDTFRGYGPEQGYDFLIQAIIQGEYAPRGVHLSPHEVFVSDGSKCDVAHIQELFDIHCRVGICDPVYPVYRDSNIMAGRLEGIVPLPCLPENGFSPAQPQSPVQLVYLCSPNNPTGTALDRATLQRWVQWAADTGAIILYDSAYSAYIREDDIPHTIYEIPDAKHVAIEFKSFSKTAGFTGVRCAFCVVPEELTARDSHGQFRSLNAMWHRRQCTMFNGVSYIVQRGAAAVYSPQGLASVRDHIDYYMENARIIREGLERAGHQIYGGLHAPYIWWKLPKGIASMDFFDTLLSTCQVVGTPGAGFGACGEGFFRLTAFGSRDNTLEAMRRIAAMGI